jgi:two-component system, sensor histidine kinase
VAATNLRVIICAALIAALFLSIVVLQSVQVAQIRRSRQEIAALSERNALNAERAEAASRAKSMFLATMSHEIRTPLNGLIGTAELMADEPLSPTQTDYLWTIRKSGEVLLDVISDILDFSSMEAHRITTEPVAFNLADTIAEVVALMEQRARRGGLTLRSEVPSLRVTTDRARVRQVLVNLVGNAVKFTVKGTITIVVTRSGPDRILVDVLDTGVGISADGIANLFKDFSQVDGSATRRFQGSGLGLAICKRIVTALGGDIGVQSILGLGSRFWFEIPCAPIEDVSEEPGLQPFSPRAGDIMSVRKVSGHVLVVEDNEINRKVVMGLLTKLGMTYQAVTNGAEAVSILDRQSFDLVLMDYQMPVMNGVDATREIRARGHNIPIVGLTANAFVDDRDICLAAGMNDFIAKPVTRDKLQSTLMRFCAESPVTSIAASDRSESPEPDTVQGLVPVVPPFAAPTSAALTGQEALRGPKMDAAIDELAAIDAAHVRALIDDLGLEVLSDLLFSFRSDSAAQLEALETASGTHATGDLDAALHALKGVSQTVGLFRLAAAIQDMRQGPPPDKSRVAFLRVAVEAGHRALSAHLALAAEPAIGPITGTNAPLARGP